jgi:glycosyltransferase involved in cell wall biosynthesis
LKKKILIFYDYFLPGFKAGGPVQSLVNMIAALGNEYDFSVITSAFDLNEKQPYPDIIFNEWNRVKIQSTTIPVFYVLQKLDLKNLKKQVDMAAPDMIYINGMYSRSFFLQPLWIRNRLNKENTLFIISPRGMLQQGALKGKALKKKIYIQFLKAAGLLKNVYWHATNESEQHDIQNIFGKTSAVFVAGNIPKRPLALTGSNKQTEQLRLVYLSLITEKKNLLLLIRSVKKCAANILLDIYGPVKDTNYWEACKTEMKQAPDNIRFNYKGDILPNKVQETIQQYDAMILLTKGENFGHALFESLSVGRPVITSHFTPWNQLTEKKAGWNVDIDNEKSVTELLDRLAVLSDEEWEGYCKGAHQLATTYFENADFVNGYRRMFEGSL